MLAALAVVALSTLAQAPDAPPAVGLPAPDVPAVADVLSKLVVLADTAGTQVHVDGEPRGTTPVTVSLSPGVHVVSFEAPGLPPFRVEVDVGAEGRTEVAARVAQQRPAADFAQKKEAYDSAMFALGLKGIGGACGCGLGAAALVTAGVMMFIPGVNVIVPAVTAIGGGVGCIGGTGLCGFAVLDAFDSPDEPIIPRVHIIKITPPTGAADATVIEVEAPPVDSDGEPIDDDDDASDAPAEDRDGEGDLVEVSVRY